MNTMAKFFLAALKRRIIMLNGDQPELKQGSTTLLTFRKESIKCILLNSPTTAGNNRNTLACS